MAPLCPPTGLFFGLVRNVYIIFYWLCLWLASVSLRSLNRLLRTPTLPAARPSILTLYNFEISTIEKYPVYDDLRITTRYICAKIANRNERLYTHGCRCIFDRASIAGSSSFFSPSPSSIKGNGEWNNVCDLISSPWYFVHAPSKVTTIKRTGAPVSVQHLLRPRTQ